MSSRIAPSSNRLPLSELMLRLTSSSRAPASVGCKEAGNVDESLVGTGSMEGWDDGLSTGFSVGAPVFDDDGDNDAAPVGATVS